MNFLDHIIGPYFDQANSLFEAFLNIIVSFFGLGYVFVRTLTIIFS